MQGNEIVYNERIEVCDPLKGVRSFQGPIEKRRSAAAIDLVTSYAGLRPRLTPRRGSAAYHPWVAHPAIRWPGGVFRRESRRRMFCRRRFNYKKRRSRGVVLGVRPSTSLRAGFARASLPPKIPSHGVAFFAPRNDGSVI